MRLATRGDEEAKVPVSRDIRAIASVHAARASVHQVVGELL
jgi:hypothetical protein